MSETNEINLGKLYSIVLREAESDTIQELESELYPSISNYIGKLKREEYDNIEAKIKNELIKMTNELIQTLLKIRLEKVLKTEPVDYTNLLDEEKYILDSEDEMRDRRELILSGILNGKSKLLESISEKHKTKAVSVRFLKEMDQMVGVDMEKYGPFKSEDIATIPFENAQALISKNIVAKIRWED